MTFKRAIPPCTPEQQARQDLCREKGCIACRMELCEQPLHTEIHHQTKSGRQISQDAAVALCAWHHRGICLPGMRSSDMRALYGPSLAKNPRAFFETYGDNAEQLKFQNDLIGHNAQPQERVSKIIRAA